MFRFRLQSVLETRQAFEDKLLREFSAKRRELENEKALLKEIINDRQTCLSQLKEMLDRAATAADVGMYAAYMEYLQGRMEYQRVVVARVKEETEVKRKELLEAVKKRKIMENLKARQLHEYMANMAILERKQLDEVSIQAFGRRQP